MYIKEVSDMWMEEGMMENSDTMFKNKSFWSQAVADSTIKIMIM